MIIFAVNTGRLQIRHILNPVIITALFYLLSMQAVFGQGLMQYKRFYVQNEFNVTKTEDLVYARSLTNYYLYSGNGSVTDKSNYKLITQLPLTLDLYKPDTSLQPGKRAVLLLIPGGGRTGCLNVSRCNQVTKKQPGLYSSSAYYMSQEGTNYNELPESNAYNYAKSGFVVLALNTRYTYHDKRYEASSTNRWTHNGSPIFNNGSAHLENLVVDIKRAIRWITEPSRASLYNIDPNNIFIQGGSGAAKMALLATATPTTTLLADSPAHTLSSSPQFRFEVEHNNLNIPQKAIRGAILFAGDMNGTKHRKLITADTGALMFWHGTKDRSILHGMAESIEQTCEHEGCQSEFYSLANVAHGRQGAASHEHTDRASNPGGLKTGVRAHLHDFIVNHLDNGGDNRPLLSINPNKVSFIESSGRADIEINLSKALDQPVSFTVAADQMREVMDEKGAAGQYAMIEKHVANDSITSGPIAYNQGTGVAFEDAANVTGKYSKKTYHDSGPGNGNPIVIPVSSGYHNDDFNGKRQVISIPAGQTSATFRVTLLNDMKFEDNECFKVRLLNANGARIVNSVESITIVDDDGSAINPIIPEACKNTANTGVVIDGGGGSTGTGTNGSGSGSGTGGGTVGGDGGSSGTNGSGGTVGGDGTGSSGSGGSTIIETVKPIIQINAPTKINHGPITDTTIIIEDNVAVLAANVKLRKDNTAEVSQMDCLQVNVKRVDCELAISGSGDLKFVVNDEAGNVINRNENGYIVETYEPDTERPSIVFRTPTKVSSQPIIDVSIIIQDNQAISAGQVLIRSHSTAAISDFYCAQVHASRVECSMNITGSGNVKIAAIDEAGNLRHNSKHGFLITGLGSL